MSPRTPAAALAIAALAAVAGCGGGSAKSDDGAVRTEKFGAFQLVASFQNILNHPNLGDPVAGSGTGTVIVANANAGKITFAKG